MNKLKTTPIVQQTGQYYKDLCLMTLPLVCMAYYFYGWRPVLMCAGAMLLGNLCDRFVALLRGRPYVAEDYSNESFALIIALLLPATAAWYVVVAAVLAGVLLGKEAFGGYGSYPFNPAAVGYAVAAVSWPEQVFRYPATHTRVALTGIVDMPQVEGISSTLKNGGLPIVSTMDLLLGDYAGPMGTTAALVVIACGLFLLVRRDIHLETPLCFLLAYSLVALLAPRQAELVGTGLMETLPQRLALVRFEVLSGAVLYGAFLLLSEPYTCPRNRLGRIVYGLLLGLVTMAFRYFGVYETGMCFALLAVNSVSGWLDRVVLHLKGAHHLGRMMRSIETEESGRISEEDEPETEETEKPLKTLKITKNEKAEEPEGPKENTKGGADGEA